MSKLAHYSSGIADKRKVQHDDLGPDELIFLGSTPQEVTDEQADALKRLCPGEFSFSAVKVEEPENPDAQGELALDASGDDSLQDDPEGAQIDPSAEGKSAKGKSKAK